MAFGVSKAIVFLAPLILSNTLNKSDYGIVEYALNIGFIGAVILNLGVSNSYPYFKLKRKFKTVFSGFAIHYLFLLISSVLLLILVFVFKGKTEYVLSILFIYTLSNQINYSLQSKTDEKIVKAVIIDALFYVVLLLGYGLILFTKNTSVNNILYTSSLYAIIFVIISVLRLKKLNYKEDIKKYQKLIKYGKSVMISGLLILLIANSGRLLLEYLFHNKELVAIFSFYFRMASFVVIVHQILNIIYFKRIYTFNIKKLDHFFTVFLGIIIFSATIMYVVIPLVGPYFFKLFKTFSLYKTTYLILCFQMIFWILLANNENVIYREKLANKMNIGFIFLLVLFCFLVVVFKSKVSFQIAVFMLYLLIVFAVFIQLAILYKFKKIKLPRTTILSSVVFILSLILIGW